MVCSHGAVSVTFHNVIVFQCYSLYLLYFWLGTQKSNTNFNILFFKNIKFDELLSEIGNVLPIGLKSSVFPTFMQHHGKRNLKTQRNDKQQC